MSRQGSAGRSVWAEGTVESLETASSFGNIAVLGIRKAACTAPNGSNGFAVLESNSEAQKMAMLFANGLLSFAVMIGPSGWGKTQLLESAARHIRHVYGLSDVTVLAATDWIASRSILPSHYPLILDNVQDLLESKRCRFQLQLALERRVRAGKPTMLAFTADALTPAIRAAMPFRREWIISHLRPPLGMQREELILHMAQGEGLDLADRLIKIISLWLPGDGRTLNGAIKRLKLQGTSWQDVQGTLRACGVLDPFLASNAKWDLRELTLDTARQLWQDDATGLGARDYATYAMLKVAQLSEAHVALFLGLEPGKAYQQATAVEEFLLREPAAAETMHRLISLIVESLVRG